jgi:hypothetical protein
MGPGVAIETFERRGLLGRRYYFRCVRTGNSEIIFSGEPYNTKRARDATASYVAGMMGVPIVQGKRK